VIQIRKVLYPTDFSRASEPALLHAVYLAERYGAELHMLHAIVLHEHDPYNPAYHFPDVDRVSKRLGKIADDQMSALRREHSIQDLMVREVQTRGVSAGPAIAEYAHDQEIDLIVMGTHGRRGIRKLMLGSVAAEVVRLAPCSVLTVRGDQVAPAISEVHRLLVPVDFSEYAKGALAVACDLASILEAKIDLVHVVDDLLHPAFYNMGATRISDLQPDILERTRTSLRGLLGETTQCHEVDAEFFALEGHPAPEIHRLARDRNSDLIVLSTRGLRGLERMMFGNTAAKVVGQAECPVLIVKPFRKSPLS
jgi:nucleotide-binding universal stress UspA family protein